MNDAIRPRMAISETVRLEEMVHVVMVVKIMVGVHAVVACRVIRLVTSGRRARK